MRYISLILVLVLMFGCYGVAQADPFTDEISKCLARNTHEAEKTLLMQWMFAAMSLHPEIKPMSNISPKMTDSLSRRVAELITELLSVRCKSEASEAIKFRGNSALGGSVELLGGIAMQGLMSNPKVGQFFSDFGSYLDNEKINNTSAPE